MKRLKMLIAGCVLAVVSVSAGSVVTPEPAEAGHFTYSGMIYVCTALRPFHVGSITDAVEIGQNRIYCWWWYDANCYAYDAVYRNGQWVRENVHQLSDGACF